jgi:hypothetical protein
MAAFFFDSSALIKRYVSEGRALTDPTTSPPILVIRGFEPISRSTAACYLLALAEGLAFVSAA